MADIPVISLWGPWANWVALGWKTIETRTHQRFKGLVGKRIGIHVAAHWDKQWKELAGDFLLPEQRLKTENFLHIGGAVICTAFVRDFRLLTGKDSPSALIDCEYAQRYGLFLSNIEVIECVPCKGRQGIWYQDI